MSEIIKLLDKVGVKTTEDQQKQLGEELKDSKFFKTASDFNEYVETQKDSWKKEMDDQAQKSQMIAEKLSKKGITDELRQKQFGKLYGLSDLDEKDIDSKIEGGIKESPYFISEQKENPEFKKVPKSEESSENSEKDQGQQIYL